MNFVRKVAGRVLRSSVLFGAFCVAAAAAVTLEWDPSPDAWVAGYRLYASTNSATQHQLTNALVKVNCGTNTSCTISNLTGGRDYYFVATAYTADGQESLPSNEVIYRVPFPPPVLRTVYVEWTGVLGATNWQDVGFFRLRMP